MYNLFNNISVCMATYQGENFLSEQLASILKQLGRYDEIVIVDDCSTDNTIGIIESFNEHRIRLFQNSKNLGHVKSFEKALCLAKNDIILLSDQDDVWIDDRLEIMVKEFVKSNVLLMTTKQNLIIDNTIVTKGIGPRVKNNHKYFKNIFLIFVGTSEYYGCTYIFDRKLLRFILPFPNYIEAHDLYMALSANILKSIKHSKIISLNRKIHHNNLSFKKRSIVKKFRTRLIHMFSIFYLLKRRNCL